MKPSGQLANTYFFQEPSTLIDHFYEAVQTGNREMAGEIVKIAIKKDGYGFNFLHDNLLNFTKEKLPSFKLASVTKKTHVSRSVSVFINFFLCSSGPQTL